MEGDEWKTDIAQPLSTRVSHEAHRLISDLQDANMAYSSMSYQPEVTPLQWRQVERYQANCRKDLYAYLMELERRLGIRRTERLRF